MRRVNEGLAARVAAIALALAVLPACGCGGTTQARGASDVTESPLLREPTHGLAGERIDGDVSLLGLPLGSVSMRACPASESEPARIESRIRPAALLRAVRLLRGSSSTTLRPGELRPERSRLDVRDGDRVRSYRIRFYTGGIDYEYERTGREPRTGTRALGEEVALHDIHTGLALLRAWQPSPGARGHFFVAMGRDLWRVEVRAVGREAIVVEGTPRLTMRIDGEARRAGLSEPGAEPERSGAADARRTFSVWLEEGAAAVPAHLVATSPYGDLGMARTRYDASPSPCVPLTEGE